MISFISGTVLSSSDSSILVDTGGVGYRVILPERVHGILSKAGAQVKLFIHPNFNPREGSFELYGFETQDELSFFNLLLTVSGVGPKSAQGILSAVDLPTLAQAIVKGDYDYLRKLSGIGPKTSQRIILELKAKLMEKNFGGGVDRDFASEGEAIDALVALGYTTYHAREAIKTVTAEAKTSEEKIRQALRILSKEKK